MRRIREILVRIANLVLRRRNDERLRAEIEDHIALQTEENIRSGMTPGEARRQAILRFGAVEVIEEAYREQETISFIETIAQDVRFGVRVLKKNLGFTIVAVLTLALGIGANTAIFSAAYDILLAPLEYPASDRLALIWGSDVDGGQTSLSLPELDAIAARGTAFEGVSAIENQSFWLSGSGPVSAGRVSGNFFSILGIKPSAGRWILPSDAHSGREHVVVLSHKIWELEFGSDPHTIGKTIVLRDSQGESTDYEVIGILPAQFASSGNLWLRPDLFFPMVPSANEKLAFEAHSKLAIARLKPGVTMAEAQSELQVIAAGLAKQHAKIYRDWTLTAQSLQDVIVHSSRVSLLVLSGAVTFLLLIACLNVSTLVLYRGWSRRQEVAIRQALGASRWRVVRQLVIETVLLALAGGFLGVVLARWGVVALRAVAPADTPRIDQLTFHPVMLWYALGVSVFFGFFSGAVSAWQVTGVDLESGLKLSGTIAHGSGNSRPTHRFRFALIIVEVACAMVLLAGSSLLIRSFLKLTNVETGFRADHVLTMLVNIEPGRCSTDRPCLPIFQEMLQRIRALPGVKDAAITPSFVPDSGLKMNFWLYAIEGQGINPGSWPSTQYMEITPGYFDTLGVPLLGGRAFTSSDHNGAAPVAIVNESFARKYFDGAAVGKRLAIGGDKQKKPEWIEIVGQVGDARDIHRWEAPGPAFYLPLAQRSAPSSVALLVRTAIEPGAIATAVREQITNVDRTGGISDVRTLDDLMWSDIAEPRFRTALMSSFGMLGLLLAAIGIYGVIAYAVTQRTHEVGIRIALGARGGQIAWMVLREGFTLTLAGVVIGLGAAIALSRYLQTVLFEITPLDPLTFGLSIMTLIAVALVAGFFPARRASRVDPMEALRYE